MNINADLSKAATMDSDSLPWVPSPLPGVDRRMLERDGEEVARATSIVRYAANSSFSLHTHAMGEEFLVLSGVFSDESGDFPRGMYVRNPPGSKHTPASYPGCQIFVKLRQMNADDERHVRIDTLDDDLWIDIEPGQRRLDLYEGFGEQVCMIETSESVELVNTFPGGAEYFVIEGGFDDDNGHHGQGSWLRLPAGSEQVMRTLGSRTVIYRKTGHLDV